MMIKDLEMSKDLTHEALSAVHGGSNFGLRNSEHGRGNRNNRRRRAGLLLVAAISTVISVISGGTAHAAVGGVTIGPIVGVNDRDLGPCPASWGGTCHYYEIYSSAPAVFQDPDPTNYQYRSIAYCNGGVYSAIPGSTDSAAITYLSPTQINVAIRTDDPNPVCWFQLEYSARTYDIDPNPNRTDPNPSFTNIFGPVTKIKLLSVTDQGVSGSPPRNYLQLTADFPTGGTYSTHVVCNGGSASPQIVSTPCSALDPADSLAAAHFRATHNSYSGPYDSGDRGAILDQLDSGVRLLELDIHDDDFAAYGDYRLGHDDPGSSVWLDGRNPRTTLLTPWLQQIRAWTDAHPFETPVVVMLDTKDDFGGPPSAAAGNFAALNDRLRSVLGSKLILPEQLPAGPWPSVDAFRGRVIAVVSGDARAAYARDAGHLPAVAMNASGQVVEVHDDGDDTLWYWSGQRQPDGRIRWLRHGRYDSGRDGAVVLTDDGYVIEVHKSENEDVLYYHVGLVTPDFDIQWSPSHRYDNGVLPTVALTSQSTIREIHRSQNNSQNWQWVGTLNRGARTVTFSRNQKTSSLRFDKTSSNAGGARIVVTTGAFSGRPSDSLFYSTNGPWTPIAYWQVAFLDNFADDPAWMLSGMRFASAHQGDDLSFVQNAQSAGQLVRVYQFDPAYPTPSPVTFPATDHPFSPAYDTYARNLGF